MTKPQVVAAFNFLKQCQEAWTRNEDFVILCSEVDLEGEYSIGVLTLDTSKTYWNDRFRLKTYRDVVRFIRGEFK